MYYTHLGKNCAYYIRIFTVMYGHNIAMMRCAVNDVSFVRACVVFVWSARVSQALKIHFVHTPLKLMNFSSTSFILLQTKNILALRYTHPSLS